MQTQEALSHEVTLAVALIMLDNACGAVEACRSLELLAETSGVSVGALAETIVELSISGPESDSGCPIHGPTLTAVARR